MSKSIANLTYKLLIREIEDILDSCHYHSYRHVFAIPELRQQLMTNVLNRVPACYALVEEDEEMHVDATIVPNVISSQLHYVVAEEINRLVEDQEAWVSHHIPQEVGAGFAPSNWFG
ncbi:hypothetical protein BST81_26075 [Leptolyngbya sp. 'hensonii']|nr:hypothetical protein BST81_26075 [Leptolyngbya sp. 'hensonii']